MTKKLIATPEGVQEVELTAEEISQRETDIANAEAEKTAEENAKTAHETLKASAKAKLIAGEALTEDEANTIVL
jgi:hypothetical protein